MNLEFILKKLLTLAEDYAASTDTNLDDAAIVILRAVLERVMAQKSVGAPSAPLESGAFATLPGDFQTDVEELVAELSNPND